MSKLALALLALALPTLPLRGPCDLKGAEKKAWCTTCIAYVPRGDVKAGACPKDKGKIEIVDVCVKSIYVAKCHPTTTGLKPVTCCGILYDKPTEDLAKILWACATCNVKAGTREFEHPPTCTEKKVAKTCEKSGRAPHSTIGK